MPNLVLAETRQMGVKWLADNATKDNIVRKTQTEIDYAPGAGLPGWRVLVTENHARGIRCRDGDGIFLLGNVSQELLTAANNCFATAEGGPPQPAMISKTWIKKQELIQQMQDLEREERILNQLAALELEGADVTGSNIDVDTKNRTFRIYITGRFS